MNMNVGIFELGDDDDDVSASVGFCDAGRYIGKASFFKATLARFRRPRFFWVAF
jgi:hypothetical protein